MVAPSRRTIALLAGAAWMAPWLAHAQAGPADQVAGVYRGKVTEGPGAGTAVVVTVVRAAPNRVKLLPNRPVVLEAEVPITVDGSVVTQSEGGTQVRFDLAAKPPTLEYRPGGGVVFFGAKL